VLGDISRGGGLVDNACGDDDEVRFDLGSDGMGEELGVNAGNNVGD